MTVSVSRLTAGEEGAWDAFVRACPSATFFHLAGWRHVIARAFGHKTHYTVARRNGEISGVLPLTQIKSPLFGHSLISNAFCVFGGPAALDQESSSALEAEAIRLAKELKVDYIEFRSETLSNPDWVKRAGLYVGFSRPIHADLDANMKAIPRKQRAMVRKGIEYGLVSVLDDNVDRLHHIYAQMVRNLGTPVFSRLYFRALKDQFGDDCDIVTITHNGEAIASVMNFYFRDQVLPYYGGGTAAARKLAGNDFLYWEVMRRAHAKGMKVFDFGRSKVGTGAYRFKKNWGFEPTPITPAFLPIGSQDIPQNNPTNPKYALMISAWQRMPLFLTKIVGPPIVRQIG